MAVGEESADLSEGDSINLLADVSHSYRNVGSKPLGSR